MITKAIRDSFLKWYSFDKELAAGLLRFQFPHDQNNQKIVDRNALATLNKALKEHRNYDEASFSNLDQLIDVKKSKGNFFQDHAGNRILDLTAHAYGQYLGYNNDALIHARQTQKYDFFLTNNTPQSHAPTQWADLVRENLMVMSPEGTNQVHLVNGQASEANDAAISAAFHKYAKDHGADPGRL